VVTPRLLLTYAKVKGHARAHILRLADNWELKTDNWSYIPRPDSGFSEGAPLGSVNSPSAASQRTTQPKLRLWLGHTAAHLRQPRSIDWGANLVWRGGIAWRGRPRPRTFREAHDFSSWACPQRGRRVPNSLPFSLSLRAASAARNLL